MHEKRKIKNLLYRRKLLSGETFNPKGIIHLVRTQNFPKN